MGVAFGVYNQQNQFKGGIQIKGCPCNKQKMAENRKKYWNEVVQEVQRAGINQQTRLKAEQRSLNRQYQQILDEQIARNRQAKEKRSIQKIEERRFIEEEVRMEKQKKITEKREKMRKQLQSKEINYELLQQIRASRHTPEQLPEHPFIKLVQNQQERKIQTRKKMMLQNDINLLQTKIKRQEQQQIRTSQKKAKEQYIKYVDKFYDQKIEDRNIFKRKYLKLNGIERSHLYQTNKHTAETNDVDYQYRRFITNQIEENHLKKTRKDQLDQMMQKLNQNVSIPSSSPAFIGRTPLNYDRQKQLQYLAKGTHKRPQQISSQNKIQTSVPFETRKKGFSCAQEVPHLQQYFSHQLKTNTEDRSNQGVNSPDIRTVPEKPGNTSQKGYKIRQIDPMKARNRMNTEPSEPFHQRKKFTTFDIILGKSRQIYI